MCTAVNTGDNIFCQRCIEHAGRHYCLLCLRVVKAWATYKQCFRTEHCLKLQLQNSDNRSDDVLVVQTP